MFMDSKIKLLLLLLLLIGFVNAKSQDRNYQFVFKMKINETMKKGDKIKKETFKFLGNILDVYGNPIFKVITFVSKNQASKVVHGQSQVIFLNPTTYNVVRMYYLSLPEELPFKLEKNKLFFNYKDDNGKKLVYTNAIDTSLPKLLCVAPDDCY